MSAPADPTTLDRLWSSFRALSQRATRAQRFFGIYEYAVRAALPDGSSVDAEPTATDVGLPGLVGISVRTGIPGAVVVPRVGSLLAVAFLNGDPARYTVIGAYDATPATPTTSVTFSSSLPAFGVARVGDAVGPFVVTTGSTAIKAGG